MFFTAAEEGYFSQKLREPRKARFAGRKNSVKKERLREDSFNWLQPKNREQTKK